MRVGHALCLLLKVQPSVTKPSGVAVYECVRRARRARAGA
jgi:hypothetical protein